MCCVSKLAVGLSDQALERRNNEAMKEGTQNKEAILTCMEVSHLGEWNGDAWRKLEGVLSSSGACEGAIGGSGPCAKDKVIPGTGKI
jgi:hypothetical protein